MSFPTGEWGKQIKNICEQLGGQCRQTGSGHYAVTFQNGKTAIIPATPSDYRARQNVARQCEKTSGKKLPRTKAGKYRHRRSENQFTMTSPSRKSPATALNEKKLARLAEIDERITQWLLAPPRVQHEVENLLNERLDLAIDLRGKGYDVPLHYIQKVEKL